MSIHRTIPGAGILLLLAFTVIALSGCTEEPASVALSAGDCAPVEVRCYR